MGRQRLSRGLALARMRSRDERGPSKITSCMEMPSHFTGEKGGAMQLLQLLLACSTSKRSPRGRRKQQTRPALACEAGHVNKDSLLGSLSMSCLPPVPKAHEAFNFIAPLIDTPRDTVVIMLVRSATGSRALAVARAA